MIGIILVSFWDGIFSGAIAVSFRECDFDFPCSILTGPFYGRFSELKTFQAVLRSLILKLECILQEACWGVKLMNIGGVGGGSGFSRDPTG